MPIDTFVIRLFTFTLITLTISSSNPPEYSQSPAPPPQSGSDDDSIPLPPPSPSPQPQLGSEDLMPAPSPIITSPPADLPPSPTPTLPPLRTEVIADVDENMKSEEHKDSRMSGGKKAGIAFGLIATACFVGFGGIVYRKRQQNIRRAQCSSAARLEFF